jgi:hypothetical protein
MMMTSLQLTRQLKAMCRRENKTGALETSSRLGSGSQMTVSRKSLKTSKKTLGANDYVGDVLDAFFSIRRPLITRNIS